MMKVIELESWDAYRSAVDKLKQKYNNLPILFRGHSNSTWHLKTTLERYSKSNWTIKKYCDLVIHCLHEFGPIDDYSSDIPSFSNIEFELNEHMSSALVHIPDSISFYWTYLRHHGFPSPLLDWTVSPYIAAFFAFCDGAIAKKVAVFAFIDSVYGVKHVWKGEPQITSKWLKVHECVRHKRQQSCYTIATKATKTDHQFAQHEHVFRENEVEQDVLIKFLIPATESIKAMNWLDKEDINYYSLMADNEAKLKTFAFRNIILKGL